MGDSTSIHAEKPDGRLLIRVQETRGIAEIVKIRVAGHQSAVKSPVETDPRQTFVGLILDVRGLVKGLVVVNTENLSPIDSGAQPADLGRKITRADVSKHYQRREPMKIGQAHTHGRPVNFRIFPRNGEKYRRVAERGAVVSITPVLPQVIGIHHRVFSKCLLKAGIELVALAGANRRLQALAANDVRDHRIRRSNTGQDQVFVERRLQHARIRGAQYGVGLLDVVSETHARLRLPIVNDASVQIEAHPKVKGPVPFRDRVLRVQRQFLDVGVTVKRKQLSVARKVKGKKS